MVDVANFAARNFGYGPDLASIDMARNRNKLAQQEIALNPVRQQALQQQIDLNQANENRINQQSAAADQAQKVQWLAGASRYALQHPEAWDSVVQMGKAKGIIPPDFNQPHDPAKLQDFVNQVELMSAGAPVDEKVLPKDAQLVQNGKVVATNSGPDSETNGNVEWKDTGTELRPVYQKTGQPVPGLNPMPKAASGGVVNDQAKEMAYQQFLATGETPKIGGRSAAAQISLMNYIADRAASEGQTAAAAAAKRQAYQATQGVVKEFSGTRPGTAGGTLTGINTAVAHMDSLLPLIDALGTGDIKQINKIRNAYQEQTGNPAPTNFQALKEFVSGEVAKAVLPGGGGELERKALSAPLDQANSPQAIRQAVEQIQVALAGKTEALRNQWDIGTNGTQGAFDKFLMPATKKALGLHADQAVTTQVAPAQQGPAPLRNASGWVLHQDAQGNKAYVNPQNPSQFEEVQ